MQKEIGETRNCSGEKNKRKKRIILLPVSGNINDNVDVKQKLWFGGALAASSPC